MNNDSGSDAIFLNAEAIASMLRTAVEMASPGSVGPDRALTKARILLSWRGVGSALRAASTRRVVLVDKASGGYSS